jgi:hypothetical protein
MKPHSNSSYTTTTPITLRIEPIPNFVGSDFLIVLVSSADNELAGEGHTEKLKGGHQKRILFGYACSAS